jgi:periplasmic divalent cation tolerance protein
MDIIVVYCTVPNKRLAKDITKILMKHKLAACVSMIENVKSVFSWDGEICEEKEVLMMIKTRRSNYGKIKLVIEDMHSYSVPEIIALPVVDCSEDYLKWLVKETE